MFFVGKNQTHDLDGLCHTNFSLIVEFDFNFRTFLEFYYLNFEFCFDLVLIFQCFHFLPQFFYKTISKIEKIEKARVIFTIIQIWLLVHNRYLYITTIYFSRFGRFFKILLLILLLHNCLFFLQDGLNLVTWFRFG